MRERVLAPLILLLCSPVRTFTACVILATAGLLFDGTLFKIWSLNRNQTQVLETILTLESDIRNVSKEIKQAQDPVFIERQARERFQLVQDQDLLFIFSN